MSAQIISFAGHVRQRALPEPDLATSGQEIRERAWAKKRALLDDFHRGIAERVHSVRAMGIKYCSIAHHSIERGHHIGADRVGQIANGKGQPTAHECLALAVGLGCSVEWIMTGKGAPPGTRHDPRVSFQYQSRERRD